MSTYEPQEGALVGWPPCRHCGAAYRLHHVEERTVAGAGATARTARPRCPTAYRPSSLEEAQRELAAAEASGDANRIFVARGEVQRLQGRETIDQRAARMQRSRQARVLARKAEGRARD
jgi:hypothetical protein